MILVRCPVPSFPVLSHPVLSCPFLSCPGRPGRLWTSPDIPGHPGDIPDIPGRPGTSRDIPCHVRDVGDVHCHVQDVRDVHEMSTECPWTSWDILGCPQCPGMSRDVPDVLDVPEGTGPGTYEGHPNTLHCLAEFNATADQPESSRLATSEIISYQIGNLNPKISHA